MSIIYIQDNDFHTTLTTMVYKTFWMSYVAIEQGHIPYINLPRFKSVQSYDDAAMFQQEPNLWNWYFEQPFIYGTPQPDEVRTWGDVNDCTGEFPLMAMPLSTIRDFYHKNLKFNQATNNRGQMLVDKYNIDFSKTIGITWRGTDIYLENQNGNVGRKRTPIENYFQFIDEILNDNPDYRIACTAEEMSILDPLLKRYPMAFTIEEFEQSPFEGQHNPERFSSRSGYERGLQPALMVWLFSKCKHYIKNRSSTGAVASWISDGRVVCINHPESLGHDNKIGFAEIEGKLYPLQT
jgi:hypothetical protein